MMNPVPWLQMTNMISYQGLVRTFPNTWYVDHHGTPCKILRSTYNKVHYIRKGRTCIASMFRFNHDFEPVNKADADRIAEEIETA
ncbi:DUF4222 domain-containing protein, partial [Escherichia coli]